MFKVEAGEREFYNKWSSKMEYSKKYFRKVGS